MAERSGATLLSAFGYDFVPGALAAGPALADAGGEADAVDVAYFSLGFAPSGGTRDSTLRVMLDEGFGFAGGRIRPEPIGRHVERFTIDARPMVGVSVPAAEHLGLPQSYPRLRDIRVMLGFPGSAGRVAAIGARLIGRLGRIAPLKRAILAVADRRVKGSTGGPDATERARGTAVDVARARRGDRRLSEVTIRGPNPYEITADLLAWGAITLGDRSDVDAGARGPISAFGLDSLQDGCRRAGLERQD